jgi:hypothetical protein
MDATFIHNNHIIKPNTLIVDSTVPAGEEMYHSEGLTFEKLVALAEDTGAQKVSYFEALTADDKSIYNNSSVSTGKYFVLEYLVNVPGVLTEPVVVKNYLSPFNPFVNVAVPTTKNVNGQTVTVDKAGASAWVAVLDIKIPYRVPHVLINNMTAENSMSKVGLAGFFRTKFPLGNIAQSVKLEGPFSKWFEAVSMKGEDLSVFTVLAPNLMESLMTATIETNIEFVNNHVYIVKTEGKAKRIQGPNNMGVPMSNYTLLMGYGLSNASLFVRASRPAATVVPTETFTALFRKQAILTVIRLLVVVMALMIATFLFFGSGIILIMGLMAVLLDNASPAVLGIGGGMILVPLIGIAVPMISHSRRYKKMRAARLAYAQGN